MDSSRLSILEKGGCDEMKRTCTDFQDPMTIRLPLLTLLSKVIFLVFNLRVEPEYVRRIDNKTSANVVQVFLNF